MTDSTVSNGAPKPGRRGAPLLTVEAPRPGWTELGAGRSGKVFLVETPGGPVARKVFGGDRLAKLVHYVFTGAPNPYIWNEDALACALYRREIVALLAKAWFGPRLQVAAGLGMGWDEEARAYWLDTAFVRARPVALLHPFRSHSEELEALTDGVMKPLQARLIEAGVDGVVWQAGKGNPVALNNFLLDPEGGSFVLIDLESGVPALFPADLGAFFSFYLPKSLRHRRPLFDDVDTPKLMRYLAAERADLEAALGAADYGRLVALAADLAERQEAWKGLPRTQRSIRYALKKGRLSPEEAQWFSAHPLRWLAREGGRLLLRALQLVLVRLPARVGAFIARMGVRRAIAAAWRFMLSPSYRLELAQSYVASRIEAWREREQLTDDETETLTSQLDDPRSSYLTDFGVHLGLKAFIQTLEYTVFAVLLLTGVIGLATFGLLFAMDGPVFRTLYTGFRILKPPAGARERPWVALAIGLVPFLGTLAYPGQMIYSARGNEAKLAKFIVYDSFGRLGQKLPILGGEDTQTEHAFNRLAKRLVG